MFSKLHASCELALFHARRCVQVLKVARFHASFESCMQLEKLHRLKIFVNFSSSNFIV